jgi:hypothetical protein
MQFEADQRCPRRHPSSRTDMAFYVRRLDSLATVVTHDCRCAGMIVMAEGDGRSIFGRLPPVAPGRHCHEHDHEF